MRLLHCSKRIRSSGWRSAIMNPSVKVSSASGRSCPIAANTPSSSSGERASNERKVNPTLRAGSCVSFHSATFAWMLEFHSTATRTARGTRPRCGRTFWHEAKRVAATARARNACRQWPLRHGNIIFSIIDRAISNPCHPFRPFHPRGRPASLGSASSAARQPSPRW